jgi:hypothetical protein
MQRNDQTSSRGSRWGSHVVRQVKHRPTAFDSKVTARLMLVLAARHARDRKNRMAASLIPGIESLKLAVSNQK